MAPSRSHGAQASAWQRERAQILQRVRDDPAAAADIGIYDDALERDAIRINPDSFVHMVKPCEKTQEMAYAAMRKSDIASLYATKAGRLMKPLTERGWRYLCARTWGWASAVSEGFECYVLEPNFTRNMWHRRGGGVWLQYYHEDGLADLYTDKFLAIPSDLKFLGATGEDIPQSQLSRRHNPLWRALLRELGEDEEQSTLAWTPRIV